MKKLLLFLRQTGCARLDVLVSFCLILAFLFRIYQTTSGYLLNSNLLNGYECTEFLINFQGGFVRRGLLGEGLYQLYSVTNFPIVTALTIFCYLIFAFVVIFFFRQFYKKQYSWWLLLSPVFLGFTCYIVRKDYLLYALLIGILYLLRNTSPKVVKRLLACALMVFGLFLHEAFIFWGFPIYALLLFSCGKGKALNLLFLCLPMVAFVVLSVYKGSAEVADAIVNSWNSLLPGDPLAHVENNSIGALGWGSKDAFMMHLTKNLSVSDGCYGAILLPMYVFGVYYMFTNFLSLFGKNRVSESGRLAISLLYSLTMICLIPMHTVLSCDNGRVFQYATVATFATFLIIPQEAIISAFPKFYVRFISRFNDAMNRFLPPSKGLLIVLLLFTGMSPCYFTLTTCWSYSVVGSDYYLLGYLL